MEAITLILIGLLVATTVLALWNHIVHFLQQTLIPFLRRTLGDMVADAVAEMTIFLDKRACPTREALVRAWASFKYHVLGIRTRYEKRDANTATATTEAFVRTSDGKVVKQTTVEEIAWHDLPEDIRAQMLAKASSQAQVDDVDVIERRLRERMEEEGMSLEMNA